jgi:LuxR family quorum-sensing system transcriptional regulator CciR
MSDKKNIESLISRLYAEESPCGIKEAFIEICRHYSFDRFFLAKVHYSKNFLVNYELISNDYPAEWLKHYAKNQYYLNDPRLEDFGKIHPPFAWDLENKIDKLSPIQQKIFNDSCDFNVKKGMTIPFYAQNGSQAFLSVLNKKKIHPEAFHILTLATDLYFEKKKSCESKELISTLTPREHEILSLKSEGHSAKEIAKLLQISESTVTFHLINIKKKLHTNSIDHTMFKFGAAMARSA